MAQNNQNYFLWRTATIAATAGLLFGFDTGNIAGALIFIQHSFHTSTFENELIVSVTVLGAFLGAIVSGTKVERYGRRHMLLCSAVLFVIGAIAGAISNNVAELIVARVILGLAIGISSYTAPLYISEIAPAQHRGRLVLLNGVAITAGEVLAFLFDYWLSTGEHWRWMIVIGVVPAVILLIGMFFMPESPRWLMMKNKDQQAAGILKQLRGYAINNEIAEIKAVLQQPKVSMLSMLRSQKWRMPLMIGVALGILQQFFGINTVMYYGPFIFKEIGIDSASGQIFATFLMGLVNMAMAIFMVLYVDRWGRRTLLMFGSLLSGFSLLCMVLLFHYPTNGQTSIFLIVMMLYIIGYCISVGSLFWLIIAEIFPLHIRGVAMSFATSIQWLANFIVSLSFLSMLDYLGSQITFLCFAGVCFISFVFSFYFVPETKKMTLEEIESYWTSRRFRLRARRCEI